MTETWNPGIPLITNQVAADILDIEENFDYLMAMGGYWVDYSEADQGAAGSGNSVKDLVDAIGTTKKATLLFKHNAADGSTTTYSFGTSETIPSNINIVVQNGALLTLANGVVLTFSGYLQPVPYQIFSLTGTGTPAFTDPQDLIPEMFGAVGDGSTDDSTAINAAIDALETSKGGTVKFLSKTYACNITLKQYVGLEGASTLYRSTDAGVASHNKTILLANATGIIVDTPVAAAKDMSIRNIAFQGLGSGTALVGLRLRAVNKGTFENLAFDNIADQAILLDNSDSCKFDRIFAQNCLLDTSQAAKIGVLHISATSTDNFISNSEFTPSLAGLTDANAYICAIVVAGAHNYFTNVIAEIADVGVCVTGAAAVSNFFTSVRADLNYTHGFEVVSSALNNRFVGCEAYRNSRETTNTYNGFNVTSGNNNVFNGCAATNLSTDTTVHKYGFFDNTNSGSNRNVYVGCYSSYHDTAWFFDNDASVGTGAQVAQHGPKPFTADDLTPSVDGYQFFTCSDYTGAKSITDFDDGYAGQIIHLLDTSATGYITIVNGTNIYTNTGANVNLTQNYVYSFIKYNNKWYQLGT